MYLKVRFESNSIRLYTYFSPLVIVPGQYVIVNVYGEMKLVEVVSTHKTKPPEYTGEIKSIVGVGYMLEDLDQPQKEELSLLERFTNKLVGK